MAHIPRIRIPTEVIRDTLIHSTTIINEELLRLPEYLETKMTEALRPLREDLQAMRHDLQEMRQEMYQVEDRALRRAWNAHRMPDELLLLPNYVGEPTFAPHSHWGGGVTVEKVNTANGEEIEELILILGLTSRAAAYPTDSASRKLFLALQLGIPPAP